MSVPGLPPLNARQQRWVDHVRDVVVPRLPGTAAEQARTAAIVLWWALKEGVLDVSPNPWRHNLCNEDGVDRRIGDLDVCPGSIWQVGMAGIQPSAISNDAAERVRSRIYREDVRTTLRRIARDAGLDEATAAAVERSDGTLRRAWLLRDPAIAFVLQRPFVEKQCLQGNASWCAGSWETARRFAGTRARNLEVVAALERYVAGSGFPWLLAAAAIGGAAWWALATPSGDRFVRGTEAWLRREGWVT